MQLRYHESTKSPPQEEVDTAMRVSPQEEAEGRDDSRKSDKKKKKLIQFECLSNRLVLRPDKVFIPNGRN